MMKILILIMSLGGALCFLPSGKDSILSGIFLRDLVDRINGKGVSDGISYLDFTDGLPPLDSDRLFPMEYDALGSGETSDRLPPSLRDQEFMRHSSLWGKQYISGGSGEEIQMLRPEGMKNNQEIKTDSTLPAYCNPPNPCPVGYSEEQGCIMDFENSASFSRRYQAAQDCMCDTEHMFECPHSGSMSEDDSMDLMEDFGFNNMLQQSLKSACKSKLNLASLATTAAAAAQQHVFRVYHQVQKWRGDEKNPELRSWKDKNDYLDPVQTMKAPDLDSLLDQVYPHKNLVAKKFHSSKSKNFNPFLMGEKLPVAAKKGIHVPF